MSNKEIEKILQKLEGMKQKATDARAVKEIDAWFRKCQELYNSPEMAAAREREYQEMIHTRRYRGEN